MSRNCLGHVEPLHQMRAYRQRTKPYVEDGMGWRGSQVYEAERRMYLAARRRAMKTVDLPSDSAHLLPSAATCAHFNNLARKAA